MPICKKYSVGDTVEVEITSINDSIGAFVRTEDNQIGLIRVKDFAQYEPSITLSYFSVGKKLDVKVIGVKPDGKLDLSFKDARTELLYSQIKPGAEVEAEVINVDAKRAIVEISGTCVQVLFPREELSPNKVFKASDEVFVGERIVIVYVKNENGEMKFSRKLIMEDKYDEDLYSLTLESLLSTMNLTTNRFVGEVVEMSNKYFLTKLMATDAGEDENNGKLLIDPINGNCINVLIDDRLRNLIEVGNFYKIDIELASEQQRRKEGTPYRFIARTKNLMETSNPYKESVEIAFKQHTSPNTNTSIANLLEEVGQNLYTSKKRMFFELLQNADDEASECGVKVKLQIIGDYFILVHDGYAFNRHDFESITSAARSTKSANSKKTGYKGIGFKSVFTNSEKVNIKSGGYHFSFDRSYWMFEDFEKFYFFVCDYDNKKEQEKFLHKYGKYRREFRGVKDIPWQLLPVWSDEDYIEPQQSIYNQKENVAIALKMNTDSLREYRTALDEVFEEPQFMLFLRNTNRIQFFQDDKCLTIQKYVKGNIVHLVDSFHKNYVQGDYRIYPVENIKVDDCSFANAGVHIKRNERTNNHGEREYYFVRIDEDSNETSEVSGIPDRIASAQETSLSFALSINTEQQIEPIKGKGSSLFSYLPMNENRFNFPFYINADFIPKSDREGVQSDNPWNHFLFYVIGRSIVLMTASLASKEETKYLELLPIKLFDGSSQDTNALAESFNRGYKQALREVAYILNDKGEKVNATSIIIDKSELSDYIGDDFYFLIQTGKRLPHPEIESSCLSQEIFDIETLDKKNVLKIINDNLTRTNEWIKNADEEKRTKFYEWIAKNEEAVSLSKVVASLCFGAERISYNQVMETNAKIITTEKIDPIRDILSKMGYSCSSGILENHPLNMFFEKQNEKNIFERIQQSNIEILPFDERLQLFNCVSRFEDVGEVALKEWKIFHNQNGAMCSLADMSEYSEDTVAWLSEYVIKKEEYHKDLKRYLVGADEVYFNIVVQHIDDILSETTISEVFNYFREKWTAAFTTELINKKTEGILPVVEQSDDDVKRIYIRSITGNINLHSQNEYSPESDEYRVIKLAAAYIDSSEHIRSIIFIDGIPLVKIGQKDTFYVSIGQRRHEFYISNILPSQANLSLYEQVVAKFTGISGYENIFKREEVVPTDIFQQLGPLYQAEGRLTCEQFYFLMLYMKSRGMNAFTSPFYKIEIDEQLFLEILDQCLKDGTGDILKDVLTYRYIVFPITNLSSKYIDCEDYTIESERIPDFLNSWVANSSEKKEFLKHLGVHDENSNDIRRRKLFEEGGRESILWNLTDTNVIRTFLNWVSMSFTLPITDEAQVYILRSLFSTLRITSSYIEDDFVNAWEWPNTRYKEWEEENDLRIFIVEGSLPCRGVYGNMFFYRDYMGEYKYFGGSNTIYISSNKDPESILVDVYSDRSCPFTKDDWNKIFLVSADVLEEKNKVIDDLKSKLEKYEKGDANNVEVPEHGEDVNKGTLSEEERIETNREARIAAKIYLEKFDDYDCSDWEPNDSSNIIKGNIRYKGRPITVLVTSSRASKLYLYPRAFAEIMEEPDNLLLNYGSDGKIHSLSFDNIFKNNPNVNLIFDIDIIDAKTIAELANQFINSRKTCFVIENPTYSANDVINSFGLNEKKVDGNVITTFNDDDIYNL